MMIILCPNIKVNTALSTEYRVKSWLDCVFYRNKCFAYFYTNDL